MGRLRLVAVGRPEVGSLSISPRLRAQLVYFMSPAGAPGVPPLGDDEFWIAQADRARWLTDGVLQVVSPLDSTNTTEVELSDEQEALLLWLDAGGVQHVRVEQ